MTHYIEVLNQAIPGITAEDLYTPFKESGIHSLDSIILRDFIEKHFGFYIPDADWYNFNTLAEALQYCDDKKESAEWPVVPDAVVKISRRQEIKMPQMANSALSENWLLKEIGDMHWDLLSKGLEQSSSGFTDALGNRLYAAFVRINYAVSPLNEFAENESLQLTAGIKRFGNYAYYSSIDGHCNGKTLRANMLTSFSCRKENDNAKIVKSNPEESINHIEEFEKTPNFYIEHRLLKKGLISHIQSGGNNFKIVSSVVDSIRHTINPYFEINGVGLLYFASYPIIADRCTSEFFRNTMEMKDFDRTYFTTYRDIFYFANCNADDQITVALNSVEQCDNNSIKITSSLYRESDNKLMARIFTIKQKTKE